MTRARILVHLAAPSAAALVSLAVAFSVRAAGAPEQKQQQQGREQAPAAPRAQVAATAPAAAGPDYDEFFTDAAMRIDLFHTGTDKDETYSFDRAVREPLWPGIRKNLVDPTGFGKYRFRVEDLASGRLVFSLGYCTLFGEWQATEEAMSRKVRRSFEESVRFPFPRRPVRLRIDRRVDRPGPDGRGEFREIFSIDVDPNSHLVSGDARGRDYPVIPIHESGDPRTRIDILILGDGYAAEQMDKYRRDARRFAGVLLSYEAYGRNESLINIRGLEVPSRDSGPDEPRKGVWRDTAFGTSFNTFDSERYLTTSRDRDVREIASSAPYDTIYIMVNTSRYGGGGIYNLWSIFPSDNEYDEYVFVHEFGHGFAGLGDEYFDSSTTFDEAFYADGVEPWEPNITAFLPGRPIKWASMIAPGTPIPTPDEDRFSTTVGAFEGAGYKPKGLYRPYRDCKMFHKGLVPFCPICGRTIDMVIGLYAE